LGSPPHVDPSSEKKTQAKARARIEEACRGRRSVATAIASETERSSGPAPRCRRSRKNRSHRVLASSPRGAVGGSNFPKFREKAS
jgi:hypothetical protein